MSPPATPRAYSRNDSETLLIVKARARKFSRAAEIKYTRTPGGEGPAGTPASNDYHHLSRQQGEEVHERLPGRGAERLLRSRAQRSVGRRCRPDGQGLRRAGRGVRLPPAIHRRLPQRAPAPEGRRVPA